VPALFGRALALHQAGRLAEAEPLYREILAARPGHFDALHHLGLIDYQRGEHDAALGRIDAALKLNPAAPTAHNNRGVVLAALQRLDEALASYDRAIALTPDYVDALVNRGNALKDLKRFDGALASYDKAIVLAPAHAVALAKRGIVLHALGRFDEAVASFDRAIALRPHDGEACNNRGSSLVKLGRLAEAVASYERAIAIRPDDGDAVGNCLQAQMNLCNWSEFDAGCARLNAGIANKLVGIHPFQLLPIASTPAVQVQCAQTYVAAKCPAVAAALWRGERYAHARIRVAYASADLRDHPVAYLAAGLFARHDRSRFEVFAISFGDDTPGEMRAGMKRSFDRFIDAHLLSDREVACMIRDLEIDITVDLNGFTDGSRPTVFAQRPAPVHVNYLGYAGTLGQAYCDYIIADRFVIPAAAAAHYVEQVAYLPDCFMVNDAGRKITPRTPSRAEAGLPARGVVFCCFNNSFKITPDVFDVWMRLLDAVPDSVLWLSAANPATVANLRRAAERRGVAPDRLIFASRVPLNADHLARLRLADLFLDTFHYNAHATAADALWAGVPVLTCPGSTFASRVAGSLLGAVGLPELIAASPADYEALGLRLARDPARLAALRQKLAHNRDRYPLFDTDRFVRHLEAAYTIMWQRAERGDPPRSFTVPGEARAAG
jgi:predicted O-linked N-acetylglucosamine transferase (SPINDLY family)